VPVVLARDEVRALVQRLDGLPRLMAYLLDRGPRLCTLCISVEEAHMQTKIQKWGNSLGLRIPRSFAAEAQVEEGATVDLSLENGRLLVRPLRVRRYSLNGLLRKVSRRNLHREVATGRAVGREAW